MVSHCLRLKVYISSSWMSFPNFFISSCQSHVHLLLSSSKIYERNKRLSLNEFGEIDRNRCPILLTSLGGGGPKGTEPIRVNCAVWFPLQPVTLGQIRGSVYMRSIVRFIIVLWLCCKFGKVKTHSTCQALLANMPWSLWVWLSCLCPALPWVPTQ